MVPRKLIYTAIIFVVFLFNATSSINQETKTFATPAKTAVITITGVINERVEFYNIFRPDVLTLRDYSELIKKAKDDPEVEIVIIKLDNPILGWAKATQLRRSILQLKNSGKPVFIYLHDAGLIHYYIASAGSEILMSPTATLNITGIGIDVYYLKELLNKIYVQSDILAIGKYKTAAESLTQKEMSPEAREMFNSILDNFYEHILDKISETRKLSKDKLKELIDNSPYTAEEGLNAGLIDGICYEGELQEVINKKTKTLTEFIPNYGLEKFHISEELSLVDFFRLIASESQRQIRKKRGKKIALIYAVGYIFPGAKEDYPFTEDIITADDIKNVLEKCAEDDEVVGAVLRVESGGGSASASDLICYAVAEFAKHKPIVASLGDTAASGGYYIAMSATKIVAEPFTLTGSIGVIGGKIVLGSLYEKIGVHKESLSRGKHHQMFSETAPFTSEEKKILLRLLNNTYQKFIRQAGNFRGIAPEEMDKVAQGRVWTGEQAQQHGLVDELGGIDTAINLVKNITRIAPQEEIQIVVYPKPPGIIRILRTLFTRAVYFQTPYLSFLSSPVALFTQDTSQIMLIAHLLRNQNVLFLSPYLITVK